MKRLTAVLLLVGLAAAGSSHGGPSFGRAGAQDGAKAAGQPQGVAWKSDVLCKPEEENSYSSPAVVGRVVYVACGGGRRRLSGDWTDYVYDEGVYAVDAGTGKKIWEFKPKRFTLSGIAVAGGVVYVGSRSDYYGGPAGTLYALDAATGREKWTYKVKKQRLDYVSPVVAEGAVYAVDNGGDLHALDSTTGEVKWVFDAEGELTAPAVSGDTVYFGSRKGFVYAADSRTGRKKWEQKVGSAPGDPAVSGGLIYVRARDENVYALGVETGERVLRFKPAVEVGSFVVVSDETLYYAGREKNFYAVDARTGRERWKLKTDAYCDWPAVVGGSVYFPCDDGTLYAADAETGRVKWSIGSKTLWYNTPSVSDGTVYFMMSDGRLYAVR